MSHKYRAAIGRESPRPASRGITTQLEPRRVSRDPSGGKSNFCGKNSGFAACREMPAFLYSRQGISSPANAEGIPEYFLCAYKSMWLPGIRQKGAAGLSADTPARQVCGAAKPFPSLRRVWPQTGWCIPLHEGVRPLPFFGVKKAAKHAVPRRQTGCALQRPRRRRTGGAKLLPPHAAGVRKSAFFR